MFFALIPFDELSSETCECIASALESMDFVLEARRMRRIKTLYDAIQSIGVPVRTARDLRATDGNRWLSLSNCT